LIDVDRHLRFHAASVWPSSAVRSPAFTRVLENEQAVLRIPQRDQSQF
jgi:hypothetical protein